MASERYNLVVVGGGAAGLVSSYIAATVKAKVALVERHRLGGDCLYTGCVPSKALLKAAGLAAEIRGAGRFGLRVAMPEVDFPAVMARVRSVITAIEPHDSIERYTRLGVECLTGEAHLLDRHHVQVGERVLRTRAIVLALGAEPIVPAITGLETVPYLTSENLWSLSELPRRLTVLGGGPIGCELAQAFQRLGSQVTVIERSPRILPREDDDVANLVTEQLRQDGVTILTNTGVKAVHRAATGFTVTVAGAGASSVPGDQLLIAVGRRARTADLELARLGLELNENGALQVDRYLRANGHNIYACGDLIGPFQFTHVASHQAWYAAVNALFAPFKKFAVDYRVIPRVTFTDPEVAQVGLSESEARAAAIPHEVSRYPLADLDRALADGVARGQVKVLTAPGKDRILGASVVGARAGELITEFVTAMKHGIGLNQILGTIHAYPTFSEANKYAAGVWKKAHAPATLLSLVATFHRWRR